MAKNVRRDVYVDNGTIHSTLKSKDQSLPMYSYLNRLILKAIRNSSHKPLVCIFRGFPLSLLDELAEEYKWPLRGSSAYHNDLVSIDSLMDNSFKRHIATELFGDAPVVLLTNEEALVGEEFINTSDRQVAVFVNDLLDAYPNETSFRQNLDTELNVTSLRPAEENELFSKLYAESVTVDNQLLLRPLVGEYNNAQTMLLTGLIKPNIDSDYFKNETTTTGKSFTIANEDALRVFMLRAFRGELTNSDVSIAIDPNTLSEATKLKLICVSYLLYVSGCYVALRVLPEPEVTEQVAAYRGDFAEYIKQYWHGDFRSIPFYENPALGSDVRDVSQGHIVERIVANVEHAHYEESFADIFVTAPTGAGKSLLFQLPAIYTHDKYKLLAIVVSPLKALMSDQVRSLKRRSINYVEYLNSDRSFTEREEILEKTRSGDISILYLSPELLLSYDISYFVGERKIGLLVVDEAHLITTWGRDFRVDYWYLGTYLKRVRMTHKFPVACFTATAVYNGNDDTVFDTIETLDLNAPEKFIGIARRADIDFAITPFVKEHTYDDEKFQLILQRIRDFAKSGEKTLVYCPYVSQIESVRRAFQVTEPNIAAKLGYFYSGLPSHERNSTITRFTNGEITCVLATKAFGMGVDIPDIRNVYHFAPNGTMADYVQEIGRAARDPEVSGHAVTDFGEKDLKYAKALFGLSSIKHYQVNLVMAKLLHRYDSTKRQNMLFAIEDFSYIYSSESSRASGDDFDNKLKSTLLLIEKDFLRRYRYNVIIARPKSLFSHVYACVESGVEQRFLEKYGKYAVLAKDVNGNEHHYTNRGNAGTVRDAGSIYKIDLGKLWEYRYADKTFPQIKYEFYDRSLFKGVFMGKIHPRYELVVRLKEEFGEVQQVLAQKLDAIAMILSRDEFTNKYFSQSQLAGALRDAGVSKEHEALASLFCTMFTNRELSGFMQGSILQARQMGGVEKYKVISNTIHRLSSSLVTTFRDMFNGREVYSRYINVAKSSLSNMAEAKCAYFLEALGLGEYEFIGGKNPQIFVRINDVRHLRQTVTNKNYRNKLLDDIHRRHVRSMEILKAFFTARMSTAERWDFIEQYFLGRDLAAAGVEETQEEERELSTNI